MWLGYNQREIAEYFDEKFPAVCLTKSNTYVRKSPKRPPKCVVVVEG